MSGVESTIADLEKESLSTKEYKDTLERFQINQLIAIVKNIDSHCDEAKWLQATLEDLAETSSDREVQQERARLGAVLERYQDLMPTIEVTETKSSLVVRCYEYKEEMEQKVAWLNEAEEKVREDIPLDDVQSVSVLVEEQEGLLSRLEEVRPQIQSDIARGRALAQQQEAPVFVEETVQVLEDTLKETEALAQEKYVALKDNLKNWQDYEELKNVTLELLREAETEANRSVPPGGQEAIQKELNSKERILTKLQELSPNVTALHEVGNVLQTMASEPRQEQLRHEISDIEYRYSQLMDKSATRVEELKLANEKWNDFYQQMGSYSDWLADKESELNKIQMSDLTLDEQYKQTQVILEQIQNNDTGLRQLEEKCAELSQGFRSRETASAKSKVTNMRRTYEKLSQTVQKKTELLSDDVSNWHQYQDDVKQLVPWIDSAEAVLDAADDKIGSFDDALQNYEQLQGLLSERDSNLSIYDHMMSRSHHLGDKPGVAAQTDSIQQRWSKVTRVAEDRAHKLHKVIDTWNTFNDQTTKLGAVADKFERKLEEAPDIHAVDPGMLENELAMYKALQEELKNYHGDIKFLSQLSEQLAPALNTAGANDVRHQQQQLADSWHSIDARITEKIQTLSAVAKERKAFWNRLEHFEEWLHRMQKRVEVTNNMYGDEIGSTLAKLETLQRETLDKQPEFEQLSADVTELSSNCSQEDRKMLEEQYKQLSQNYGDVKDLLKKRIDMCARWDQFSKHKKGVASRIKILQQRLDSQDLSQDDVDRASKELMELQSSMSEWNDKQSELNQLMAESQITVKDRPTQRTLHIQSEIQNLATSLNKTSTKLEQKKGKLDELAAKWQNFEQLKQTVLSNMASLQDHLQKATVKQSSLEGIKDYGAEIKALSDQWSGYASQYEELRSLGRELMSTDPGHAVEAQSALNAVDNQWEATQAMISEKQGHVTSVIAMWQQYDEASGSVHKTLDKCRPLIESELPGQDQLLVKQTMEKYKVAELDLHGQQRQVEHLNAYSKQLMQEARTLPGFDASVLQEDVSKISTKWKNTEQELSFGKGKLEEQLAMWDQIQTSKEEVSTWLEGIVNKLEENTTGFGDTVDIKGSLYKYKLAAAVENFTVPETVKKCEEYINDGKLLHAHKCLTDLERSRDDLLFELHKQTKQSPTDVNTVNHYFSGVEKLSDSLGKQLWLLLQRTLQTLQRDQTVIVSVLHIIEREERNDAMMLKRYDQTGFLPPNRPKRWHQKAFQVMEQAVLSRIEGNQMEDRTMNKMWLVRHLEVTRQIVLDDLRVIKTLCEPCFPPHYDIVNKYIEMYHNSISQHLTDIIHQGLEGNEIVTLLMWIHEYYSEEMMGNPDLKIDISEYGPLLEPGVITELQNMHLQNMRTNLQEWMGNSLRKDSADWYRSEPPDADHQGYYQTSLPVILYEMLQQNLQVASTVNEALVQNVAALCMDELAFFIRTYRGEVQNYKDKHYQDRSQPQYFLHYMMANVNNCDMLAKFSEEIREKHTPPDKSSDVQRFKVVTQMFHDLISELCDGILDEVFLDLDSHIHELVTRKWLQSSLAVDTICVTIEDYCSDFVHLKPPYYDVVLDKARTQVAVEYIKAMFTRKITFKNYQERGPAAEKIVKEADQLSRLFNKFCSQELDECPFQVLSALSEILKLKDSSMLSLELAGFMHQYPDIRSDQMVELLLMRGDLGRSKARQLVTDCFGEDHDTKTKSKTTILSKLFS